MIFLVCHGIRGNIADLADMIPDKPTLLTFDMTILLNYSRQVIASRVSLAGADVRERTDTK
jgi:hypothetical protein